MTANGTPDGGGRCPFCGGVDIETMYYDGVHTLCRTCKAGGPGPHGPGEEAEAIAAFTRPAHALSQSRAECEKLRAESVRLRELFGEVEGTLRADWLDAFKKRMRLNELADMALRPRTGGST